MVKILYNERKNIIIRRYGLYWTKGEVKDVSKGLSEHLLKLPGFSKLNNKIEEKETINYDLNNDGVVDEKDLSIAGKVLAHSKKKNK
jgi:hypothetical protein